MKGKLTSKVLSVFLAFYDEINSKVLKYLKCNQRLFLSPVTQLWCFHSAWSEIFKQCQ